jgi:excisionase family DNA binding protein
MTIEEAIAAAVEVKLRPVIEEVRALRADLRPLVATAGDAGRVETEWLAPADVARELSVKVETVRTWIKKGKLKATRVERALRTHRDDLRRFVDGAGSTEVGKKVDALAARLKKLQVVP